MNSSTTSSSTGSTRGYRHGRYPVKLRQAGCLPQMQTSGPAAATNVDSFSAAASTVCNPVSRPSPPEMMPPQLPPLLLLLMMLLPPPPSSPIKLPPPQPPARSDSVDVGALAGWGRASAAAGVVFGGRAAHASCPKSGTRLSPPARAIPPTRRLAAARSCGTPPPPAPAPLHRAH